MNKVERNTNYNEVEITKIYKMLHDNCHCILLGIIL